MASLAQILVDDGYIVRGSDIDKILNTDKILKERNIQVLPLTYESFYNDEVIIIGHDFYKKELIDKLDKKKLMYFEYNEFLDFYINKSKLISICGSHGKTTLVDILSLCDSNSSYLRGDGEGKKNKNESFFFLESCEYKEHFLSYHPKEAIITNIDYDHVDYFKTPTDYINAFNKFIKQVEKIYINYKDKEKINHDKMITFGSNPLSDYYCKIITMTSEYYEFEVYNKNTSLGLFKFKNLGKNILELAVSAIGFYNEHQFDLNKIKERLLLFKSPHQRLEEIEINSSMVIIDYAHHPTQIENNYYYLREKYPNRILIGIFRGDRYSRVQHFKNEIIFELEKYDYSYLLPLPLMDENDNKDIKFLSNGKIKYISSIREIESILKKTNCVISLMSSKPFIDEIEYLKKIL